MNKILNLISEYFVHLITNVPTLAIIIIENIKIIQKVLWNFTPYEINYVHYNY